MKTTPPNNILTTVLMQRKVFVEVRNGEDSQKEHGPQPQLTVTILAAVSPESGKEGFGSPSGAHVERQGWDVFPPDARHFWNVEKKQHGDNCYCVIIE
jgi:hypothetical protein